MAPVVLVAAVMAGTLDDGTMAGALGTALATVLPDLQRQLPLAGSAS